jgi:heptosyltransferase-1
MGDILHALPAVTALRRSHPSWVIDWVVESRWKALLAAESPTGPHPTQPDPGQPLVDTIHLATTKQWRNRALSVQTLQEIRTLRRDLRAGDYDAVLDLQGAIRSALVCRLAGCRRVIGEAKPRESIARLFFTEQVVTRGAHVIEQDVELAAAVAGDELETTLPMLPIDPAAEDWAGGQWSEGCAHQSRRRVGRQAVAGGALCRRGRGTDWPRVPRGGECGAGRRGSGRRD